MELAISFNTPSTPFGFPTASRTSKGVDGGAWEGMKVERKLRDGVNRRTSEYKINCFNSFNVFIRLYAKYYSTI